MKKILLVTLLLLIFTSTVTAQTSDRFYDCSKTGKCLEGDSSLEALYANNLAPGIESRQEWSLENNSASSCRVYLRLRSLDAEEVLANKITLSAVGKIKGREQEIIKPSKFATVLKKQSIYLGKLPPRSIAQITWSITLDEAVGNEFQATQKKFSTRLYSYCLKESKGQVAGASTKDTRDTQKTVYAVLSIVSITTLVLVKLKFPSST